MAPTEAACRWVALLQQVVEADPLACPTCHRYIRIIAFITQESVIDKPVAHLRTRAARRRDMAAADTANPLRLLAGAPARVAWTR
jgi:5,10-methylenetetrahydrofolate reductase